MIRVGIKILVVRHTKMYTENLYSEFKYYNIISVVFILGNKGEWENMIRHYHWDSHNCNEIEIEIYYSQLLLPTNASH